MSQTITVALTGASGMPYGLRLVDALLDTLTKVRAELTGAEPTFSPEPISTFAVWGQALEGRDFVGLVIDRSLPSRRAFLMPPGSARDIGHELIRVARIASSAKAGG